MIGRIRGLFSGWAFLGVLGFIVVLLQRVFRMGVRRERDRSVKKALHAYEERNRNDKKVNAASSDRVRSELSKWVRK